MRNGFILEGVEIELTEREAMGIVSAVNHATTVVGIVPSHDPRCALTRLALTMQSEDIGSLFALFMLALTPGLEAQRTGPRKTPEQYQFEQRAVLDRRLMKYDDEIGQRVDEALKGHD